MAKKKKDYFDEVNELYEKSMKAFRKTVFKDTVYTAKVDDKDKTKRSVTNNGRRKTSVKRRPK